MSPKSLLVPVDYSDHAAEVLQRAAELARSLGASVHVLNVWECMPNAPPGMKVVTDRGPKLLTEIVREEAEADMARFLARANITGVKLSHELRSGDTFSAILDSVAEGKHDMIVMGTHGRSGLTRVVLGSVAEKVLRNATVPVLTIPIRRAAD